MDPSKQERRQRSKLEPRPEPRVVRRRSGKQGSSKDRHGMVFADSNRTSTSTIRAITPDPKYSTKHPEGSPVSEVSSQVNQNGRAGYVGSARDHAGSVSNTDDENTIETRRRRTRSGAQEDLGADASSGSFIAKTRKRLGSITTSGAHGSRPEEKLTSIGFPSVIHSPPAQESPEERTTPRTPHRAFSPDSVSTYASGTFKSPNWLDPDSAKILQLMKTTCGRMHGILFFRPLHSNAWASGYCSILVSPGSLVCQTKGETAQTKTLISDLRGCSVRTHYDSETGSIYLSVLVSAIGSGFQIRPSVPETFDSWLAALLCWQPLRPKGIHDKMTKSQPVSITEKRTAKQRRISDMGNHKGTAIIKVGKMLLWDGPLPSGSQTSAYHKATALTAVSDDHERWRSVSCTLHENGTFKLLGEDNASPIAAIALSQLARCAVQRLDASVLDMPHCIAIYPQYTIQNSPMRQKRLMVICLESRVVFEAWFVMLKALTVPELYGPEREAPTEHLSPVSETPPTDNQGMFRVERHLTVRLTEAKLIGNWAERDTQDSAKSKRKSVRALRMPADVYADVICGQDLRARTTIKPCSSSVFWADEFSFRDLASSLNRVDVIVRMGNPGEQEWTMIAHGPYDMSGDAPYLLNVGGLEASRHDSVVGRVEVLIDELEKEGSIEKWWPILDISDRPVGQLLMRMSLQETVVLMSDEYKNLSVLLHNFANGLTTQMAQALGQDLRQLPGVLLDYYQASEGVHDWLSSLIEEEIDGIYREQPPSRMRYSGRIQSTDSYENAEQREVLVRDLSRSATMEANLLFRGNSLVTKALDSHMKRLGTEYLESVLGTRLRRIAERDLECEVDPTRIRSPEQLERNWLTLLGLTNSIWKAIYDSATSCPMGLRLLFRHIRSCAEDRYGSFIRTVKYTSVSGFLFLRFFCPAILNPKLFGILSDHPPDRARRTFTLIAKSLNVLANMAKFGTKEPWMEPMNKFLGTATPEFKRFIDDVCAISSAQITSGMLEPQYQAPNQIKGRLPAASREGLPGLPFLLDETKLLAEVVGLWASNAPAKLGDVGVDRTVQTFHELCLRLSQRSKECLSLAEQAEKPDSKLELKWQQVVREQQKTRNVFDESFVASPGDDPDLTALPQRHAPQSEHYSEGTGDDTAPSSAASGREKRMTLAQRPSEKKVMTNSTNSSTASLDGIEDVRRVQPSSRDGTGGKSRLFDLMSSSGRRKGRDRQGHDAGNEF